MIKKTLILTVTVAILIYTSLTVVHTIDDLTIMRHLLGKQEEYIYILERQVEHYQNTLPPVVPDCEIEPYYDFMIPWELEPGTEFEPLPPKRPDGKTLWGA